MRRELWGPGSGILFVVLFVVGLVLLFDYPVGGEGEPDETIRAFFADAGNRTRIVVAAYVFAFAGLAFAVFLSDLYTTLRSAEAAPGWLSLVVLVTGSVFVTMLFGAGATIGAVAAGMSLGGEPEAIGDTGVVRFLAHTGYGLLSIYGALAAALMIAVVSILSRQTGVFPTWVMWGGFVLAVVLLFAVIFLPIFALPLWALGVSIARLRRGEPAALATGT